MSTSRPAGALLPLKFATLPGQTYQVEDKNNLDDPTWTPLGASIPGTGTVLEVDDDLSGHDHRFYLLLVLP